MCFINQEVDIIEIMIEIEPYYDHSSGVCIQSETHNWSQDWLK